MRIISQFIEALSLLMAVSPPQLRHSGRGEHPGSLHATPYQRGDREKGGCFPTGLWPAGSLGGEVQGKSHRAQSTLHEDAAEEGGESVAAGLKGTRLETWRNGQVNRFTGHSDVHQLPPIHDGPARWFCG